MSWAEVGLIPRAEGATQGLRSESGEARVSMASAGRPEGSIGCGTAMEMVKGFGAPATPCPHNLVLGASAGQPRDLESQSWKGPGHHGDEETGLTQKGEGLT